MKRVLIVYASKNGQSQKIAEFIDAEVRRCGNNTEIYDAKSIPAFCKPERFDIVILGGPVLIGSFPKSLVRWVRMHAAALNRMPTFFFSVCLGILQKEESVQREERIIVGKFLEKTGLNVKGWDIFAGGLAYTRYSWLTRFMMKRISRKAGGDTDTSKDFEYTDWTQVMKFTHDCLGLGQRHIHFEASK